MSYKDLEEGRAKRKAKDQAATTKGKRRRKRKTPATEQAKAGPSSGKSKAVLSSESYMLLDAALCVLVIDVIDPLQMLAYVIISTVACKPWPADASITKYNRPAYARRLTRRYDFINLSSKLLLIRTILLIGIIITTIDL